MNLRLGAILVFTGFALVLPARAGEITSGPTDRISGPFNVRAITGEHRKGDEKDELCYVCKYGAEARPAVVLIFTQKADENLAVSGQVRRCGPEEEQGPGHGRRRRRRRHRCRLREAARDPQAHHPAHGRRRQGRPPRLRAQQGRGGHRPRLQGRRQDRQELRLQRQQVGRREGQRDRRGCRGRAEITGRAPRDNTFLPIDAIGPVRTGPARVCSCFQLGRARLSCDSPLMHRICNAPRDPRHVESL